MVPGRFRRWRFEAVVVDDLDARDVSLVEAGQRQHPVSRFDVEDVDLVSIGASDALTVVKYSSERDDTWREEYFWAVQFREMEVTVHVRNQRLINSFNQSECFI